MQTLSTCLWFDDQAEEAAAFYVSLFPNSRIVETGHGPEGAPRPTIRLLLSEDRAAAQRAYDGN